MRVTIDWRTLLSGVCLAAFVGVAPSAQQTSSTTETRQFEVLSVDGNHVVVRGERGVTQEITVPDDFHLTVDGRPVTVRELKPGMKGTATITTTTTVTPVHVTEVRNGEVMQRVGNSIIVRGPNGIHMYSEADARRRGVRILRDGQPLNFNDIRQGDRLTATIITDGPPQVMTERQVDASLASAGAGRAAAPASASASPTGGRPAVGAGSGAAASGAAGATAAGAPEAARTLPKTASPLPALGLAGISLLAAGLWLTLRRRALR